MAVPTGRVAPEVAGRRLRGGADAMVAGASQSADVVLREGVEEGPGAEWASWQAAAARHMPVICAVHNLWRGSAGVLRVGSCIASRRGRLVR